MVGMYPWTPKIKVRHALPLYALRLSYYPLLLTSHWHLLSFTITMLHCYMPCSLCFPVMTLQSHDAISTMTSVTAASKDYFSSFSPVIADKPSFGHQIWVASGALTETKLAWGKLETKVIRILFSGFNLKCMMNWTLTRKKKPIIWPNFNPEGRADQLCSLQSESCRKGVGLREGR
jgi:hypothetical protein